MNNKKNFISALLYQLIHIIYGLVVPRIILLYFGSDINGLISSITQFLSFISLLEGGLGAVVLAELYVPIEQNDQQTIKRILVSSRCLFNKISLFYVLYTILLGGLYTFLENGVYTPCFVVTLTFVLSLNTLTEYLLSITYRLFLQANQKIYITNYIGIGVLIVNIAVTVFSVKVYPEIRVLKALSSVAFFIQPFLFKIFVPIKFHKISTDVIEKYDLKNRWSGFAQNLAHFINMNTDIILITFFCSYSEVSVYTVYMLVVNALRMIISTVANSFQGALGKYIAQRDENALQKNFYKFSNQISSVSVVLFCTCLLLINPFVSIYTSNVNDTDYYRPIFAMVIIIANIIYCIREPFRLLILAAGKFKETNFGAIIESLLNVIISIWLIRRLGLTGVAIGTFVAIFYRMIYFVIFLRKSVLMLNIRQYVISIVPVVIVLGCNLLIYRIINFHIDSIWSFCMFGMVITSCECGIIFLLNYVVSKFILKMK